MIFSLVIFISDELFITEKPGKSSWHALHIECWKNLQFWRSSLVPKMLCYSNTPNSQLHGRTRSYRLTPPNASISLQVHELRLHVPKHFSNSIIITAICWLQWVVNTEQMRTLQVEFLTDHFTPATAKLPRSTRIANISTFQCHLRTPQHAASNTPNWQF